MSRFIVFPLSFRMAWYYFKEKDIVKRVEQWASPLPDPPLPSNPFLQWRRELSWRGHLLALLILDYDWLRHLFHEYKNYRSPAVQFCLPLKASQWCFEIWCLNNFRSFLVSLIVITTFSTNSDLVIVIFRLRKKNRTNPKAGPSLSLGRISESNE